MSPVLPGLPAVEGPLLIAEAGVNHNGSLDLALRLVDAAAAAGAAAVKFQTFVPELLAAAGAPRAAYQRTAGAGDTQLEMVRGLALSREAFAEIAVHCARRNIVFLSTPFDRDSASFLCELGVPALKVPSGEITNLPLLHFLGGLRRPLIVSTGMANLGEVERAVTTIEDGGCRSYALLHCTSNYPAAPEHANLLAMRTLADTFGCPVGYSDHTLGTDIAIAAAALGARIVEKHFTLDRALPGPDHRASLEPGELKQLAECLKRVALALGDGAKRPVDAEAPIAKVVRRSLAAARALPAGTTLAPADIVELRPGTGIPPAESVLVVGRRLRRPVAAHALIEWTMLE